MFVLSRAHRNRNLVLSFWLAPHFHITEHLYNMALSAAAFAALQPKAYHEKFLSEGLRSDGRSFVEQRSVSLQYGMEQAAKYIV